MKREAGGRKGTHLNFHRGKNGLFSWGKRETRSEEEDLMKKSSTRKKPGRGKKYLSIIDKKRLSWGQMEKSLF